MQYGVFENWIPLKLVLEGVDSVAPFITVNEQSESNPGCSFTLLLHFLLPGDHITILYLPIF